MICIDFIGGAHGNYLEFVCNKILGITQGTPFNSLGASHNKIYTGKKFFVAAHYSFTPVPLTSNKIISIQIEPNDLLPLQQVSLLRGGDYGYDNDLLEHNTYHKLNNKDYKWVLDQLISSFFTNQIKESYNAVKDSSWPEVNSKAEFDQLPSWIQNECKNVHNLVLLELNELTPDCPREVLREFFQISFSDPRRHGVLVNQAQITYPGDAEVFVFPFSSFYNTQLFLTKIEEVASWAGLQYNCQDSIAELHQEFLNNNPYKNSKIKCDQLVNDLQLNNEIALPKLDLLEEAYINAKLGWNKFK